MVYVGLTIDGFLARPDGALDFLPTPSDPNEDFGFADFASVDVVVMGRKTFDQVAAFVKDGVPWPYAGKPVYVVSRTMRQEDIPPETLAAARASDENKETKISVSAASPAETLRVVARETRKRKGSRPLRAYVDGGSIVRALLEEDLVDEMVLTTVPVLIGEARRCSVLTREQTQTARPKTSPRISGGTSRRRRGTRTMDSSRRDTCGGDDDRQ